MAIYDGKHTHTGILAWMHTHILPYLHMLTHACADHIHKKYPSRELETAWGQLTSRGIIVPVHHGAATGTFDGKKKEAIINGILFPIKRMDECAYNASCFNTMRNDSSKTVDRPSSFHIIGSQQVGLHILYVLMHTSNACNTFHDEPLQRFGCVYIYTYTLSSGMVSLPESVTKSTMLLLHIHIYIYITTGTHARFIFGRKPNARAEKGSQR
jgi:hypothetical protein